MSGRSGAGRDAARQPEQQVRVRADAAPHVGLVAQRHAREVGDQLREQLQVQVRLPAAVDLRRAEPGDEVAGAHRPGRERRGVQMPVQREEAVVLEHQQPAVVAELVAVLANHDDPVERRVHRRARRARRCRPPCAASASARPASGTRARCRSSAPRRSARSPARRRAASPRRGRAPARREVALHDRVRARAREELADGARPRAGLVAARVAEAEVRERGVLALQPLQHLAHAGLRDQQVVVVGRRRVLARRHRDAHLQPRAHQRVQHRELVLAQRRDLVVAAHDGDDRARRIRLPCIA